MTFSSFAFLLFLPIVFVLYWSLRGRLWMQNLCLVLSSYVFYGWWDYRFLSLIFITSLSSYVCGRLLESCPKQGKRKLIVLSNVLLNIGILVCFKYYNFFIESFLSVGQLMGIHFSVPTLYLVLPVGISFYTFQSLGYVIDVYRNKTKATNDFVAFLAFVSFFPQLVAGPIERASNLLPQMLGQRKFDYAQAVDGMRQALWGFFKKMVVADTCAVGVNQVWDNWQEASGIALFVGMILFTFQIYCDFSGYSDIAIGVSRLFGIRLCENFRLPYFSRDMTEFWRRWHISLMTWFRDYVYIPLGGSRVSTRKTIRNILIVFLLSGLWHGANWTFVAWGGYNAVLLIILLLANRKKKDYSTPIGWCHIPQILLTFSLAAIGWVLFRAPSITDGFCYLERMVMQLPTWSLSDLAIGKVALCWCLLLVVVEWLTRERRHVLDFPSSGWSSRLFVRWLTYYALVFAILFLHGEEQTFIYFQF